MTYRSALVLFIFSLFEAAGCSLVHTVPLAARAGDTIMVSIGSPDDVSADNITSITYTPTGGSPIIIPNAQIRSIFNVYPDKTSAAWLYSCRTDRERVGTWTLDHGDRAESAN